MEALFTVQFRNSSFVDIKTRKFELVKELKDITFEQFLDLDLKAIEKEGGNICEVYCKNLFIGATTSYRKSSNLYTNLVNKMIDRIKNL